MAIDLATLPQFLTREEASDLLRLTDRSIDTMLSDGKLTRVKLGGRRTGITRESILEHLRKAGATVPEVAATQTPTGSHAPGVMWSDFVGDVNGVYINVADGDAEDVRMMCIAADNWLPKHGLKGCLVFGNVQSMSVRVVWHMSMGYSPKKVGRSLNAMWKAIEGQG